MGQHGKGFPARGRNTLDLGESRSITRHTPNGFRQKGIDTELVRFVEAGVPAGALPLEIDWEVYVPSSRIMLFYAIVFDQDGGQPTQPALYTYNATWGPVRSEARIPSSAVYQPVNVIIPALTTLPDSREVNTGVKRIAGTFATTGAPTVLGAGIPGCWRLLAVCEPNQHFTGADEEWDRIADEVLVQRRGMRAPGGGGGGINGGGGAAVVLIP